MYSQLQCLVPINAYNGNLQPSWHFSYEISDDHCYKLLGPKGHIAHTGCQEDMDRITGQTKADQ